MRIIPVVMLCFAFSLSTVFAENNRELLKSMAELDKSYIPALALTGKAGESPGTVKKAIDRFSKSWKFFRDSNTNSLNGWKSTVSEIDIAVEKAGNALKSGNLKKSHDELESVRETLLKYRRSNGLVYYLDDFTVYHEVMEKLIHAVSSVSNPTGSKGTELLLQKAVESWNTVERNEDSSGLFGLGDEKKSRLHEFIQKEKGLLMEAVKGLKKRDDRSFSEAVRGLKPVFTRAFFLFGDFSASQK